jgi:sugar phosphate isomerase/epimerase
MQSRLASKKTMNLTLGLKTDCIEARCSFEWLFDLLVEEGITFVQLGSFYELYWVDDDYFVALREKAESRGLRIKSVFTAHRELGGFFSGDPHLQKAARKGYEKLIRSAQILGADFVGSNPGAVYRDRPTDKEEGCRRYLAHMKELTFLAKESGLRALTIEPMSSLFEPPTTPSEMAWFVNELGDHHRQRPQETTPVWLCGDISHGLCSPEREVVHSHWELFQAAIPFMCEFHFKNTDEVFGSTFGFSEEETKRGVVDLHRLKKLCDSHAEEFPVDDVTGYLEIMGPKLGRDYSDPGLGPALRESLAALKSVFR